MRGRASGRLALVGVLAMGAAGCDWAQFRSDAAHTGNIYETELGVDNVADLAPLWTVEHDLALPGVVTAEGAVVVVADGEVRAYETATGEPRWAVPLPTIADLHREWAPPSSHDGIVHVGYTDPLFSWGVHGGFLKIDAGTGVDTMVDSQSAVRSPATFDGDDVWYRYAEVGPMGQGVFTGIEGRLADGRTMRTLDGAAFTGQGTPPAVADGVAYAMRADDGFLDAYDADATEGCSDAGAYRLCTPLWSAPVTGGASPAVSGSTVFASTGAGVAAYAAEGVRGPDQQPLWQADVAGASAVALDPAADATRVFVGSSDGTLKTFAAAGCGGATTCAPAWEGLAGGAVTAPAVANGVVYVGSADGFVHAFAGPGCGAAPCAPLWSAATPGVPTQVVVASGRLHVLTGTGELVAFGLP
jgi:outer membrane protein assembly factor BamB